ncbi:hypothetical protein GS601_20835 [Myxacorys almedinensis A]|uniref:Uncharacterized protein n=1 Tax=Myxacorys almedinensis A TaxID=2690445 RepID=A0A8J7Z7Z1_9CYAN|nr:hypothetical protein [Myxacorys almedinensis]NDJ19703.1 hypothetical protein [Myxacorys almedinensis A]
MFLTELSPFVKELSQQPIAFLGGLASGFLRLSLTDDPVKSWLEQQTGSTVYASTSTHSGNGSGPQSISID